MRLFDRTGFRCTSPLCRARTGLHAHHVVWRSRGGSDDDHNLSPYCAGCHRLIHVGDLEVTGRAPDDLVHRVGVLPDGSARETWIDGMLVESVEVAA